MLQEEIKKSYDDTPDSIKEKMDEEHWNLLVLVYLLSNILDKEDVEKFMEIAVKKLDNKGECDGH